MKRIIYNFISLLSMAAVLFVGVSCEEEKPIEKTRNDNSFLIREGKRYEKICRI